MKPTKKSQRVVSLLSRAKRIKERKNYSCENLRDELNEDYLSDENKVSTASIKNWFSREDPPLPSGEFILALQDWVESNE